MRRHLILILFALFAVAAFGCGGSSGGAAVGNNGGGGGGGGGVSNPPVDDVATGALAFSFARAQTTLIVPQQTVRLRFSFTDQTEGNGTLVLETTRDFATSIIIDEVPITSRSVRVTALDSSGTPLFTGIANVTVVEGQTRSVAFTPLVTVVATEIVLDPNSVALQVGGKRQFTAQLRLSDGSTVAANEVRWSSRGTAITVDGSGLVTAVAPGVATIVAQRDALTAEAEVSVKGATSETPELPDSLVLTSFTLDQTSLSLQAGSSAGLVATGILANGTVRPLTNARDGLTYVSSNAAVASVDDAGRVMAVAEGVSTITATARELTSQVRVQVRPAPSGGGAVISRIPVIDTHAPSPFVVPQGSGPFSPMPNATVTDDQSDLGGGQLKLDTHYDRRINLILQAPETTSIGTITGNGIDEIQVTLAAGTSPGQIAQFLRELRVTVTGPQGIVGISIELDDGQGNTGSNYVPADVRSNQVLELTVNRALPSTQTNFNQPQLAMNHVSDYGADGSTITLSPGDYRTITPLNGNYELTNQGAPRFTIRGANAGVPIGVAPQPRSAESVIASISLDSYSRAHVTIDGLTFDPNRGTSPDGPYGVFAATNSYTVRNCIFGTSSQDFAISDFGLGTYSEDSVIEDCRISDVGGGFAFYGAYSGSRHVVRRSVFSGLGQALFASSSYDSSYSGPALVLRDNVFCNNTLHLDLYLPRAFSSDMANNDFSGTGYVELQSGSAQAADLRGNWWGQPSGPRTDQLRNLASPFEILTTPFLTVDPLPTLP